MSLPFALGGQSIGALVSASVLPKGLISFRTGWFDLLAVQGTVKNLLQHPSLKVSIVHHSVFLMVQLSYPYITGKNIALTLWTFVSKVMSLLFNMMSDLVSPKQDFG